DPEALNGEYFSDLAALLARPDTLPASLRNTLLVLEHAATPENDWKVQDAIHRRIPRVLVSRTCPLDRVLDLWFLVPDELSQFNSANKISNAEMQREHSLSPSEGERAGERGPISSPIENQKSKIKNPDPSPSPLEERARGEEAINPPILQPSNPPLHYSITPLPHSPSDSETFSRLAQLSLADYDRIRHAEATRLGIRKETLDAEVARCRAQLNQD